MSTFREKYLKYKMKYIQLKKQLGGVCNCGQAESNADCPVCRDAMPAAAAMGNAEQLISVTVVSMSGKSAIFPISRNATILELKGRIQANNELGNLEIYRQKLMYRPGRYGMEPLADNLTLFECGIGQIDEEPIEVDLLLEDNLLEFSPEIIERVIVLLRNIRTEELTNLLSQYVGTLMISNLGQYYRPPINFDPASRWLGTLANALRENTTVTRLIFPRERFLDEDFISLTDALKQNTNITSLILTDMNLVDNHISALAGALKVNRTITAIVLSRNNFGDDGATELADALKSNNTITHISLDYNRIRDVGAAQLADALKSNNKITYINLSNNKIGDVGAIQLVNALKENTTVMHFEIYRNIINRGQNALRELHALRPELTIGSEYHVELW